VFFSYIGFDSVSTLAGEVKNPGRNLPIGIIGTLLISTALYAGVSLVVTGMVPYYILDEASPLASAFEDVGLKWAAIIISAGSITTLTATTLVTLFGQPRIFYQMSVDGLLPARFSRLTGKGVPRFGTIVTGIVSLILGLIFDLAVLTNMISIGTLMAFTVVCGGIIILRFPNTRVEKYSYFSCFEWVSTIVSQPWSVVYLIIVYAICSIGIAITIKMGAPFWILFIWIAPVVLIYFCLQLSRPRSLPATFSCPLVPFVPLLGMFVNLYLIIQLPYDSLYRVAIWTAIGVAIYIGYGIRHSRLNSKPDFYDPVPTQINDA